MKLRALEKSGKLPQTEATWQATLRLAPAWVAPKGKPSYRPYLVVVLNPESGAVRSLVIQEQRPEPETVLSVILNAMSKPVVGGGGRNRPARIQLDDSELVQSLQPRLAEIEVQCSYAASLPAVDAALRGLSLHLNRGEMRVALVDVPGVTLPLLAELYSAAAYFWQQAPWRWADNLAFVEVRYPAGSTPLYAAVMGFGGQEFGLAVYPTLEDVRWQLSGLEPPELFEKLTTSSVTFGDADFLTFEDLDAIKKHRWTIAEPGAHPLLMKITPPEQIGVPEAAEIAMFAAVLRTLPDFLQRHMAGLAGMLHPAEATFNLPNVHANQQIEFRYPVELEELNAQREDAGLVDEELEEMIADWHWDEPSHVFARPVGLMLLEFLNYLEWTGLSGQVLRKHERNCWLIGKLTCKHGGYNTFRPDIFLGGPKYTRELQREYSASAAALAAYAATWRKLERYIRRVGYV